MMKIGILGQGISGIYLGILLKLKNKDFDIYIFDKNDKTNKKMLATGNGRCNLGNLNLPYFAYNNKNVFDIVNEFNIEKQIEFYNSIGIEIRKIDNLIYPNSLSSTQIVNYLNKLIKEFKIKLINDSYLKDYNIENSKVRVDIHNKIYVFDKFIIATGGKSSPNLGSDGSIFKILKKHKYDISEINSGLCPIKIIENVKGIEKEKLKAKVSLIIDKKIIYEETGEVFFKNDGLSGIVIMNISSIIKRNPKFKKANIKLDLFPEIEEEILFNKFKKYASFTSFSFLEGVFTIKVADYIRKNSGAKNLYKFDNRDIKNIVHYVKNMEFTYLDNYDFNDSQVSIGGIKFNNLKSTLESKSENNIYFIGEVLDADGICGGYNIMFALASAYKVSKDINLN